MFKAIVLILLAIIAVIFGAALTKPDTFSLSRSIAIKAPPEKIYGLINDFHNWSAWSPWEKLDPNMQRTFTGAPAGKGAQYAWTGNKEVGSGRMEITDTTAPAKIVIKLDFIAPFEASNVTEFQLTPQGDTTTVNWTMSGPLPFVSKLMTVFVSMDSMVGKDFEKGLANLKAAAEK